MLQVERNLGSALKLEGGWVIYQEVPEVTTFVDSSCPELALAMNPCHFPFFLRLALGRINPTRLGSGLASANLVHVSSLRHGDPEVEIGSILTVHSDGRCEFAHANH